MVKGFIMVIAFSFISEAKATDCKDWFRRARITAKGFDCVVECSAVSVDMNTFQCPNICDELCGVEKHEPKPIDQVTGFFGFNTAELKLTVASPKEAKKAYELSRVANDMTDKVLRRNLPRDESDAFRHFVWAALMVRDLGHKMTKKVLDAHESDLPSSDPDRAMDMSNNRKGIAAVEKMIESGQATNANIEKAAVKALNSKDLTVMNPKGDFQ